MRAEPLYRITFSYRETFRAGDDVLLLAEGSVVSALHWEPLPEAPGYDHGET